ncbi:putative alpha-1,2-mannosidase [Sphingobacterium allocomposti]|uniref:Putative alpha-1,2-mannosidase n=1 Tax=Sphingobacterium allocomposti TaxID=415956 RepID=A0A5S5D4J0_9SPHI|nr:GH92 family glycosyl hydrolase [Sphingobacterium composti Yoo et al. 2007 non Ten et al. 2007]TYP90953.1 putative alpha-1,2-mannosidase [Sphingobacterium composti Yoo et al. 2007 non Ten et al. 2007]HLS95151.1 GH92 family glycosyl hydrolase [Sphingobacterium sp.]
MKFKFLATVLLSGSMAMTQAQTIDKVDKPIDLVSTLVGTQSTYFLSTGNTYPAIAMPWGMNFWSPQTGKMGDGWMYMYTAEKLRGFKQTHQPSPWMNDYGQFSIMPMVGVKTFDQDKRASYFSHKAEVAKPHYYSVYLADYDVTTEITPTERAAYFRFTFPKTDEAYVLLDAFDKGSYVEVIPNEQKIVGYSTKNSGGVPDNFKNYFVLQFDRPFANISTFADSMLVDGRYLVKADHVGALVGFQIANPGDQVLLKVASSFISREQAERNLRELEGTDFDQRVAVGENVWNTELKKIEIEGGSIDDMRTFYSCLYRSLLFPRMFYEIDANGNVVHYSPYNGEVLPGYMFTDTGFWDTFRSLFPFLNLMYPEMSEKMQDGLANAYRESGWLPEWASPGLRNVMVGNNSASVVADAWIKGIRSKDIETLYEALKHGANNAGPLTAVGRAGASYYNDLGYVPYDVGINENAARTLEYAYDDFAIYQLAKALNKPTDDISFYKKRSFNYEKLFDPSTGLMRGKNKDGRFQAPFNPFKWGDAFTEGNSWHYTWSVFQDVEGLAKLMGGHRAMEIKLDSVFSLPPIFDDSYYGFPIHEIREMQVANMGQYAHGNQPIQHMIYLYNHVGAPWKAQYWVRETMKRMYSPLPDGYCGDEDNGQTSAWYVFSALGFYPVTPAVDEYVVGAPLFKKATLHLSNGKKIVVEAPKNSDSNRYIHAMKWNGKGYTKNFIKHSELVKGATLSFDMAPEPNKSRGTAKGDLPFSLSKDDR